MANAYKQAGVDIEAGYEAVNRMKKHVARNNASGSDEWFRRLWWYV